MAALSQIPRLTQYGETSPQKPLSEMTGASTNARDASRKHYLDNEQEPVPKRKTLAERAGEPSRSNLAAPPSSRPVHPSVTRTVSTVSTSSAASRKPSFSQSYRQPSIASTRTISSNSSASFSASVNGGALTQPQTLQTLARPRGNMGLARIPTSRAAVARPRSVQNNHGRNPDSSGKIPNDSRSHTKPMVTRDRHGSQSMPPPLCRKPLRPPRSSQFNHLSLRDDSLSTRFQKLHLDATPRSSMDSTPSQPTSPSKLPRPITPILSGSSAGSLDLNKGPLINLAHPSRRPTNTITASPIKTPCHSVSVPKKRSPKQPSSQKQFLTRFSNLETFDFNEKALQEANAYKEFWRSMETTLHGSNQNVETLRAHAATQQATITSHEERSRALEDKLSNLEQKYFLLKEDNTSMRLEKESLERRSEDLEDKHDRELSYRQENHAREVSHLTEKMTDLEEKHVRDTCVLKEKMANKTTEYQMALAKQASDFQQEIARLSVELEKQTLERHEETVRSAVEQEEKIARMAAQAEERVRQREEQLAADLANRVREQNAEHARGTIEREQQIQQKELHWQSNFNAAELSHQKQIQHIQDQLQAKITYLESDQQSQSSSYAAMERERDEALATALLESNKARKLESQRRRLHDQIQNLKGNIRVICRQRPALISDGTSAEMAVVDFPDMEEMKSIALRGPEEKSSLGTITTKTYPFTFDKALGPGSSNEEVFEQVEPLVQSAVDGYNVTFFAYGQTGSGKTHTMSAQDGMMPRATQKIYHDVKQLEEMGWTYTLQGSFVEVYNETINDLLGDPDQMDKKKHEIHHDMKALETTITGITVVDLDSEETVTRTVNQAMARRAIAATKLNERSSRSHSIFILKLAGHNSITSETSRGTLNLVDLAGSERVSRSGVEGERLKETQNINKSLSCLKDVIAALGSSKDGTSHIPYRNSKLTHLLQLSLGGNSKTLMFVMVSPLKEHLGESLSSLKFAAQVNNTHIGTAKKVR